MARLELLGNPELSIELLDEEFAQLNITQKYTWNPDLRSGTVRAHKFQIDVFGDDDSFRGGDDRLTRFLTDEIPTPTGVDEYQLTSRHRVRRNLLDEDKPHGLRARARRRRDKDEIFINTRMMEHQLLSRAGGGRTRISYEWHTTGESLKSNTVCDMRF